MAASSKDIQLRELKDTISQLKTMMSEQTELIKTLRLVIDEKADKERMVLCQEKVQVKNDFFLKTCELLTRKFFSHSA